MRSVLFGFLAAALCLTAPLTAGSADRGEIPGLQAFDHELVSMLQQLTSRQDVRPVYRRQPGGFHSLHVDLDRLGGSRDLLLGTAAAASRNGLVHLANGQHSSEPNDPRWLPNQVLVGVRSVLTFWFAALNRTDADISARTVLEVKGSGRVFLRQTERLTYPANSVVLFWYGTGTNSTARRELELDGIYSNKVTIAGHGKRRTDFLVE